MSTGSLLVITAHPDDESVGCGGLIALAAARGVRVSLLCLSRGEAGQPQHTDGDLRRVRADELMEAGRVLDLADVTLLDHEDGMLPWTEATVLERDIRDAIERTRPDVIVTFGADGLYWHPDHIAVHERTLAVVSSLGDHAPACYGMTVHPGCMEAVVERAATRARQAGLSPPGTILGVADAAAWGSEAAAPTVVLRLGDAAVTKLHAIACHRSQLRDDALSRLEDADARELLGVEHFHRLAGGADTFIEALAATSGSG
ncbi:MAG: PIG-L family deacetylase [Acidimicrobiia bacterium]|nr:PIG-L family deacetylase [Acidimicrobiia bacterium]